jgi:two-component system phosphate regulon sensor histidine kinase PhoR
MIREILRAILIPLIVGIVVLILGFAASFRLAFYLGFFLMMAYCAINARNELYLLENVKRDDLIGQRRGLGIWREIYSQLEKKSKKWRQEILQSEIQYNNFIQAIQASPNGLIMLDQRQN